jgi:hypothetical protein
LFSYSTVHILFGYNSLIGAINNSILLAGSYATEAAKYTLWETPLIWGGGILRVVFGIQYILLPAVVTIIYKSKLETEYEYSMLLSLSVVLSLPLLIRSFQVYWIYPLPFLAALGAMGYEIFFDR